MAVCGVPLRTPTRDSGLNYKNQFAALMNLLRYLIGEQGGVNVNASNGLQAVANNGSLTIRISGPMDLLLTSALREFCQETGAAYRRYIVDLRDVSIVRDSGLALLLMLKRLANRTGATLHVINGSTDLMRRCVRLGISPN
jgi:anti-anti-sigma regulatory factor